MLKKSISCLLIWIIAFGNAAVYADDWNTEVENIEVCVADIYESQEYYYADLVDQKTKDIIDNGLEWFVQTLKERWYNAEKHIAIYDIVIDKIDQKIATLDVFGSYEAYDMLEYIRSVIVSYKDLAKAIQYCEKDATKVLPEASEIAEVDEQIMDMQNAMADFVEEAFDTLIWELEKNFWVQEMWYIEMNLNLNLADLNVEAQLNLDDYVMKQSVFDSQFSSDMKALFKVDDKGEVMAFDISWFLDFISKDWDMYVLLENMNFSTENIEELQQMLEKLQTFSSEKMYIKIPADDWYDEIVSALRSFDPSAIVSEMRTMMSEPLFQVDEKIWDTYILVPTKFACDSVKKLGWRFDPFFSNEECSESQYKKLVKQSNSDEFQIFMKADRNSSQLWINANDGYSTTNISINYDWNKMDKVTIESMPTDKSYEWLRWEYIYWKHINLSLNTNEIALDWKNTLRSNNSFSEAEITLQWKQRDTEIYWNFVLKSWNIEGSLNVSEWDENLFSLTTNWEYSQSKWTFSIENEYILSNNPFSYMWVWVIGDRISGNINMDFLMKDSSSEVDFTFNTLVADQEIINFKITSSSTTQQKEIEIEMPESFKLIEEVDLLY